MPVSVMVSVRVTAEVNGPGLLIETEVLVVSEFRITKFEMLHTQTRLRPQAWDEKRH